MKAPTLCMIHEGIGSQSAIAKVAMWGVKQALRAGWRVTVVANLLDTGLAREVQWLKLYVPPRALLLKWVTARYYIRKALGNRKFDVIHAHQPQVASLSDVFTCHFLTRVAYEHRALESGSGIRSKLAYTQQRLILHVEDYYYRRCNPDTRMLFCSELLQQHFNRLYPAPALQEVLENASPPISAATPAQRSAARQKLLGSEWDGPIAGYLGGMHERKGYRPLLKALKGHHDIYLLFGGEFTESFSPPKHTGPIKPLGWVSDLDTFFAACDVLLVPSSFDPCPLIVLEAAARGVPVIATSGVGNLPTLLRYNAGHAWEPGTPLAPLIRAIAQRRSEYMHGALQMAQAISEDRQAKRLLQIYNEALTKRSRRKLQFA